MMKKIASVIDKEDKMKTEKYFYSLNVPIRDKGKLLTQFSTRQNNIENTQEPLFQHYSQYQCQFCFFRKNLSD